MKRSAFTLIEIMIVVAIMGIVITIAVPTLYHQLHPDSMRKAVSDVLEACREARALAILQGTPTDLVFNPDDMSFSVQGGGGGAAPEHGSAGDAPSEIAREASHPT